MIDTLKPYFTFSFMPGYIENMSLKFDAGRTNFEKGFPTRADMENCRGLGYSWCNLIWFTPGYSAIIVDHLNLDRLLK